MTEQITQGSAEWLQARCGSLGASAVQDALAKTKTGWGASREAVKARLIIERLTGTPQDTYQNEAMRWGNEQEPHAADAYSFVRNVDVEVCGLYRHPVIQGTHASPDRLVGDTGLIEVKCPLSSTHLDTLLNKKIPQKYLTQMQWQMACTGREWTDFVSYDPRFPAKHQLFIERIERDDKLIAKLEEDVAEFLTEVQVALEQLENGLCSPSE